MAKKTGGKKKNASRNKGKKVTVNTTNPSTPNNEENTPSASPTASSPSDNELVKNSTSEAVKLNTDSLADVEPVETDNLTTLPVNAIAVADEIPSIIETPTDVTKDDDDKEKPEAVVEEEQQKEEAAATTASNLVSSVLSAFTETITSTAAVVVSAVTDTNKEEANKGEEEEEKERPSAIEKEEEEEKEEDMVPATTITTDNVQPISVITDVDTVVQSQENVTSDIAATATLVQAETMDEQQPSQPAAVIQEDIPIENPDFVTLETVLDQDAPVVPLKEEVQQPSAAEDLIVNEKEILPLPEKAVHTPNLVIEETGVDNDNVVAVSNVVPKVVTNMIEKVEQAAETVSKVIEDNKGDVVETAVNMKDGAVEFIVDKKDQVAEVVKEVVLIDSKDSVAIDNSHDEQAAVAVEEQPVEDIKEEEELVKEIKTEQEPIAQDIKTEEEPVVEETVQEPVVEEVVQEPIVQEIKTEEEPIAQEINIEEEPAVEEATTAAVQEPVEEEIKTEEESTVQETKTEEKSTVEEVAAVVVQEPFVAKVLDIETQEVKDTADAASHEVSAVEATAKEPELLNTSVELSKEAEPIVSNESTVEPVKEITNSSQINKDEEQTPAQIVESLFVQESPDITIEPLGGKSKIEEEVASNAYEGGTVRSQKSNLTDTPTTVSTEQSTVHEDNNNATPKTKGISAQRSKSIKGEKTLSKRKSQIVSLFKKNSNQKDQPPVPELPATQQSLIKSDNKIEQDSISSKKPKSWMFWKKH